MSGSPTTPANSDHRDSAAAGLASDAGVAVAELSAAAKSPESNADDRPWWINQNATLTEPAEIIRPDLSLEARALENLLISHFDGHDLTLPPLLHVAECVLPKLGNSNVSLPKIADELSEDQVIAAAILRMTNSPLFRGLNKITALQPAVTRLGASAIRTLLMHESLRAAMFVKNGGSMELAKMVWRQSLAGGYIMRGLSEFTALDKEDAFLIGLLHDIGNIIVLRVACGEQGSPRLDLDLATFDYLCHETHHEFGELIADAWNLPGTLRSLLADHHAHPADDDPLRVQRLQLILTDMICAMLGYSASASYNLLETRVVQNLGLADCPKFAKYLKELPEKLDDVVSSL